MTPAALATIHAAAFPNGQNWSETDFDEFLSDANVVLATRGQAFVLGRITVDEAEILTLACHPNQQNQGLAGAALADFHQRAKAKGATRVFLEVAEDNGRARALYEAAGYSQTGLRAAYYRRPSGDVAALVLSRNL